MIFFSFSERLTLLSNLTDPTLEGSLKLISSKLHGHFGLLWAVSGANADVAVVSAIRPCVLVKTDAFRIYDQCGLGVFDLSLVRRLHGTSRAERWWNRDLVEVTVPNMGGWLPQILHRFQQRSPMRTPSMRICISLLYCLVLLGHMCL